MPLPIPDVEPVTIAMRPVSDGTSVGLSWNQDALDHAPFVHEHLKCVFELLIFLVRCELKLLCQAPAFQRAIRIALEVRENLVLELLGHENFLGAAKQRDKRLVRATSLMRALGKRQLVNGKTSGWVTSTFYNTLFNRLDRHSP